ncbi:MAG: DUF4097 family beta strand repeat-containing protein [Micrococcales bacterium]|nr:DUF4097 family beta strand repeat-containing protein [Micrococcales bacterium]
MTTSYGPGPQDAAPAAGSPPPQSFSAFPSGPQGGQPLGGAYAAPTGYAPTQPPRPTPTGPPLPPRAPRRTRAWKVAGVPLLVLAVLGGTASGVAPLTRQSETSQVALPAALSSLTLEGPAGSIHVRAAAAGEAPSLKTRREWSFSKPTVSVDAGDHTTASGDCRGPAVCEIDWDVVVPADTDVRVNGGVGDVRLTGMAGDARVEMGTGEINLRESRSTSLDLQAGVGGIVVRSDVPVERLQVEAGVGDIDVTVPSGDSYRVETAGGASESKVTVPQDSSSERRITVRAGVGDIRVAPTG